ncbi:Multidrug resistance protein [Elasticomyces elasticus]|nr:hypothetical protein LTR28_008630 [Elasticomyces elasticus]KAK4999087.1 Multidrug resistance protein [Elasticomyces elasticus]
MYHHQFYEEDDWNGPGYPGPYAAHQHSPRRPHHAFRRSGQFLDPEPQAFGVGLGPRPRARSHGQSPIPQVNIYNELVQDAQHQPIIDARGRTAMRLGDELLAEQLAEMRLERIARSRSRGRSDVNILDRPHSPSYYHWQLQQVQKEAHEAEQRKLWESEEEAQRKADADAKQKAIDDYEKKKAADAKKAKEEEAALREKIAREAREQKEKEEREYKEFLALQKEKEDKAKAAKKAEEDKLAAEMKKRLSQFGLQNNQIEAIIDPKKADLLPVGGGPNKAIAWPGYQQTFIKVHHDHLSVDTLLLYGIPYEWDRADPNYIIILREMDKHETDILFEHTRRLRERDYKLLIEPKKDKKPEYAWVRKRERSKSTGRKEIKKVGILEIRR